MNLHSLVEYKPEKIEVRNKLQKWAALNWRTVIFITVLFIITWIFIVTTEVIGQWLG